MIHYLNELEDIKMSFLPDRTCLISMLERLGMGKRKIDHSIKVADLSLKIAKEIEKDDGIRVNKKIVEAGALLHDIGIVYMLDDLSPEHSVIGAEMIRKLGLPESVARCAETHEAGGAVTWVEARDWMYPILPIKETYAPQSIEEKIVCAGDFFIAILIEGPEDYGFEPVDLWNNPKEAIIDTQFSYCSAVYKKKLGRDILKTHPMIKRGYELHKDFVKYINPSLL